MNYLIGYLIISIILMVIFIEINKEVLHKQYLEIEEENDRNPSEGWFNFYILTHFIKSPILCPMIFLLILGNGGKIIE